MMNVLINLSEKFPHLSVSQTERRDFVGPDIRFQLQRKDGYKKKNAWISFKEVVTKLLGNVKDRLYELTVDNMIDNFKNLGFLKSLKIHFFPTILTFFIITWAI